MQIFLYLCSRKLKESHNIMENFKKYLGVFLLLLGVVFLIIYRVALPHNSLLVTAMVCEVVGILAYIFINRKA